MRKDGCLLLNLVKTAEQIYMKLDSERSEIPHRILTLIPIIHPLGIIFKSYDDENAGISYYNLNQELIFRFNYNIDIP